MSNVTLEAIEHLLDTKLDEKLGEKLEEKLAPIQATLDAHTAILETLVSEKNNKEESGVVAGFRVDRLEEWAEKAGSAIGVPIEL